MTAADVAGADVSGFATMQSVSPAFAVLLGDNVYADGSGRSYAGYQSRYRQVWGGSQFQELFQQVPVFMMWDDHEIMENYWHGKDSTLYNIGRRLFDLYQGSHNPEPIDDGELYFSFRAGDIGFFVLDTRSHRSPNTDVDDERKSMLGTRQREQLQKWLVEEQSRVHVIVSSVVFSDFTTTGKDSWRSFGTERSAIMRSILGGSTRNTLVISGDQHWSAVIRVTADELEDYSLFEFQATPLASGERAAPGAMSSSLIGIDNQTNVFGVFDIDTRSEFPILDFTMCASGEPCAPGKEANPTMVGPTQTTIPYTLHFQGGPGGFEQTD